MKKKRDFLSFFDVTPDEIRALLANAAEHARLRASGGRTLTLEGKTLGMVFEKASTRTRVSFEVGMYELGGHAVYLTAEGTQIGRGEPLRDTARVLGAYCHAIVIRTFGQEIAEELARYAPVPVVNGLTDLLHPCQVLADLATIEARLGQGSLCRATKLCWIGDGNNMANSWIEAAVQLDLDLTIACPPGYDPYAPLLARANATGRGRVRVVRDPVEAARDADVIATDVWTSMGAEAESAARRIAFKGFIVDEALVATASARAIVLHCLPAHRGEEISDAVLEGPRSAVWLEAENRLHVQKAVLELLLA